MYVWLDDRREPWGDEPWVWVKTPSEAIALLESGDVEAISLDHDLGLFDDEGGEQTGNDVLLWIEEQVVTSDFEPPRMKVHSSNSSAHDKMQRAIKSIESRAAARRRGSREGGA
jgi:hypothetical protein